MPILGYVLVGLGFIDYLASKLGVDIYALVGIQLPGPLFTYSPVIALGLGAVVLAMSYGKQAQTNLKDSFDDDEALILFRSAALRNPGLFSPRKYGHLFVTNKRLGFLGELPKTHQHLQTMDSDLPGIIWNLREISGVERGFNSVTVTARGQSIRFEISAHQTGAVAKAIQSQL